jgi:hypothetical protein
MALLAAYNFDEASGAVIDVTGNGHGFTPDASITRQAGHTGTGLRHESTAANSIGPAIFGQTAQRTLMVWVKRTSNSVDAWIVEMKNATADTGVWGFLYTGGAVQARAKNASNVATFIQVTQPSVNNWHHLAMTYDGSTLRFYIDGSSVGTPAAFAGPVWASATFFPFFDAAGTETIIDDVRVYDEALDQATIASLMNTPVSGGSSFTGSAALSGAGTLAATGKPAAAAAALGLAGSGLFTAAGSPAAAAPTTASGTGALTGAAQPGITAARALSGSGTLTAVGVAAAATPASLTGNGTLTAAGAPATADTTALAGSGTLTGAANQPIGAPVMLAGAGHLTPTGRPTTRDGDPATGTGVLALTGVPQFAGTLNLFGAGSTQPTSLPTAVVLIALAGSGALTTSGRQPPPPGRPGHLTITNRDPGLTATSYGAHLAATNAPSSSLEVTHEL